jgi:hypothetical protein
MKNEQNEVPEHKIRELFDRCNGRRSNYLILTDEPKEFIGLLVEEGWIEYLKNGSKRPWYSATNKLITKYRELGDIEVKQLKAIEEDEKAEAIIAAEEEERASSRIEERKNTKL